MEVYNTLTKKKETFRPREPGKVSMYVCGPTTYNLIHLGNARPLVVFDTIRRYLTYRGYAVTFVQNFTDIDDKIITRAAEEGAEPLALSERYIKEYFQDAAALNVLPADVHPRVTEHMPVIIDLVVRLLERGFAYEVEGNVYFAVTRFPEYGKLSGRSLDEMLAGARVEVDPRKRHPMDFALWKRSRPGEPAWDSPWGPGRPGWHIECSAMSLHYLGPGFDIHGGGADLIFPHHENEIAQSEAATGQPFVRYWLHNGFITVNREKMSKSLGNFFLVREILEKFPPSVVRFFLLNTHYRSPLDFDDTRLAVAGRALDRLRVSARLLEEGLENGRERAAGAEEEALLSELERFKDAFIRAMDDDFNTAQAIGVFFDLAHRVNGYLHRSQPPVRAALAAARELYRDFNRVLGLFPVDEQTGRFVFEEPCFGGKAEQLLELLIAVRQEARQRKDWTTADRIRAGLRELGIVLEDTPEGVRWRVV